MMTRTILIFFQTMLKGEYTRENGEITPKLSKWVLIDKRIPYVS